MFVAFVFMFVGRDPIKFYFIDNMYLILKVMDDTNLTIEATVLLFSHIVQGVKVLTIVLRLGRIKRLIKFMDGGYHTTVHVVPATDT